jgi:hypothetical protein
MRLLQRLPAIKFLLPLSIIFTAYLIWANTPQTVSVHGGSVTDFANPRRLVGYAEAVFVGQVIEQVDTQITTPLPQTQFKVEVVTPLKAIRRRDANQQATLPADATVLPSTITINQYGGYTRNALGKKQLVLANEIPLVVPGHLYIFATRYDPVQNWYQVLPFGVVGADVATSDSPAVKRFQQAIQNEIPYDPSKPYNPNE